MPRSSVRIVFNKFPQVEAAILGGLAVAVDETLTAIEQDVKGGPNAAPFDTGNLRRSYHKTKTGPTSGEVGSDPGIANYAPYVELGTSKMAAQPHLIPATEAQVEPFKGRLLSAIKAAT